MVINDWLDEDVITRETGRLRSGTTRHGRILCLGRFNQWKGQEVLADAYEAAFAYTTTERPRLRFLGAQPGTPFEGRANAIAERGKAWGWSVEEFVSDPWEALHESAVLVVPSLHPEPFGMVILEALAAGCRVVAFPGGGPSDIGRDFPDLVKVVPRSTQALANGLAEWWSNGGPGQSEAEHRDTLETLGRRWSGGEATLRWGTLLSRLF